LVTLVQQPRTDFAQICEGPYTLVGLNVEVYIYRKKNWYTSVKLLKANLQTCWN